MEQRVMTGNVQLKPPPAFIRKFLAVDSKRMKDQSLLPEAREAITALWDMTPEALAERVEAVRQSIPPSALADGTAYAAWREEIARDFAARQTD